MNNELKPVRCGCGGEAKIEVASGYDPFAEKRKPNLWYGVICKKCKVQTKAYYTEAEAIVAWNKAMGERTVGKWTKTDIYDEQYGYLYECPYCKKLEWCGNFCSNCGAKLE